MNEYSEVEEETPVGLWGAAVGETVLVLALDEELSLAESIA